MKPLHIFGLWITREPRPDRELVDSALEFARHVEKQPEPWEWKQRQVLRAMRSRYADRRVRDLNLAIEFAVREL